MASGAPQLENAACADQFIEFYIKFINEIIKSEKKLYLQK